MSLSPFSLISKPSPYILIHTFPSKSISGPLYVESAKQIAGFEILPLLTDIGMINLFLHKNNIELTNL